jgi:5'-nucleotidase
MAGIEGVDIVVGDSHTLLGADVAPVFMQQGEYPTLATTQRQSDGRTVCIVHAWDYAHLLGHLEVGFDDSGMCFLAEEPHCTI